MERRFYCAECGTTNDATDAACEECGSAEFTNRPPMGDREIEVTTGRIKRQSFADYMRERREQLRTRS